MGVVVDEGMIVLKELDEVDVATIELEDSGDETALEEYTEEETTETELSEDVDTVSIELEVVLDVIALEEDVLDEVEIEDETRLADNEDATLLHLPKPA
jgi:hypothetical protein